MPRPSILWPVRSLAVLGIVAVTVAVAAPASANPLKSADVTVTFEAARNILPTDGWSSVSAVVRNAGPVPARGARVTLTMPAPFENYGLSTSSDWDCVHTYPAVSFDCRYLRELAPGAKAEAARITPQLRGATVGQRLTGRATASTPRETNTGNNADEQVFQVVGNGLIEGVFWHDVDADGVREAGEPIVDPVHYVARSVDDEDRYGWSNNFGPYRIQVPAKRYSVEVELSTQRWRFTRPNVGSDATDSDLVPYSETTYYQYGRFGPFTVDVNRPTVIDVGLVATS
ncbi:hypothetical protein [Plantactinospora endophytica]|uniref:DUF11 domain-containing protein n=1 Tax=Plantactinospora endophytica TaxID=673535 RepID=A0ABQ4DRX8_9ACTN|nr:hypothetical protein [Plantactinospora endophytica]GIG85213.1 hypothetical protein Pen02_01490 [Plantactinospora endophytica]